MTRLTTEPFSMFKVSSRLLRTECHKSHRIEVQKEATPPLDDTDKHNETHIDSQSGSLIYACKESNTGTSVDLEAVTLQYIPCPLRSTHSVLTINQLPNLSRASCLAFIWLMRMTILM